MKRPGIKRQRGANKLEFAVTVAIFSVLAALLLDRLGDIQTEVERTEVDLTVRRIRAGIQTAMSEHIMRGEEERLEEFAKASPVDFLGERPRGFVAGRAPTVPGQWAYDSARHELAYLPRRPAAFADAIELRWRYVARTDSSGRTVGASLVALN